MDLIDALPNPRPLHWIVARVQTVYPSRKQADLVVGEVDDPTAVAVRNATYLSNIAPEIGDIVHAIIRAQQGAIILGGTDVVPVGGDAYTTPPDAPNNLNASSTWQSGGARADLSWDAPTTDTNGDPLTDLTGYELRWQYASTPGWHTVKTDSTSAAIYGLVGGLDIDWEVRGINDSGATGPWATGSFTTATGPSTGSDTTAPNPPTVLTSQAVLVEGQTPTVDFVLSWTAPTTNTDDSPLDDLADYELQWRYVGTTPWVTATTTETSFVLYGLAAGQDVEWRVRARDVNGNRSTWANNTANGDVDNVPPPAPSTPSLSTKYGTVTVVWDGLDNTASAMPADFAYVSVYMDTSPGFTPSFANEVNRLYGPGSVVETTIPVGETRYFKLAAVDTSGNVSPASAEASIVVDGIPSPGLDTTPPKPPTGLTSTPTIVAGTVPTVDVLLSWTPPTQDTNNDPLTDLADYEVQWKTPTGDWSTMRVVDPSAALTKIPTGTALDWRVRARDTSANNSTWATATVGAVSDTTPPAAPSAPVVTSKLGTITAYWDGLTAASGSMPADFDHVRVYMDTTAGFTPSTANEIDRLNGPGSAVVTTVPIGQTRYFKLIAVDTSGNLSAPSAAGSVTVTGVTGPDLDTLAPKPPTGLSHTPTVVAGPVPTLDVLLTWLPPTQNTDNTALTDLMDYEVQWKTPTGDWTTMRVIDPQAALTKLPTNVNIDWRVRARDRFANNSTWATSMISAVSDSTPPDQPSQPGTDSELGTITMTWNGLDKDGDPMPVDFARLDIHMGTTAGFTPTGTNKVNQLSGAGSIIVTGVPLGQTRYFKTIAYDSSGNASPASVATAVTVVGVTGDDIEADSITGNNIAGGTITGNEIAGGTITGSNIAGDTITGNNIAGGTITGDLIQGGTITGDLISGGTITGDKIQGGTITGDKIGAGEITANEIASGTITSNEIAANTITANDIAAGTITGNEIAAGSITSTEIAANTITADDIAAGAITSDEIAAGAITADKIGAGEITGDKIQGGTITGDKIQGGTITGDKIGANQITSNEIAAGTITSNEIAANTITGDKVAANTITGNNIAAGSITAEKIALGVLQTNLVPDPSFEMDYTIDGNTDPNGWRVASYTLGTGGAYAVARDGTPRSGRRSLRMSLSTTGAPSNQVQVISGACPVTPGKTYVMSLYAVKNSSIACRFYARIAGSSTEELLTGEYNASTLAGAIPFGGEEPLFVENIDLPDTVGSTPVPTDFANYTGEFTVPAGINFVGVRLFNWNPTSGMSIYVDDVSIVEKGTGATEITSAGIRLFGVEGTEVGAFVSNRKNYFSVTDETGASLATVSDEGDISAQTLHSVNDPEVLGQPLIGSFATFEPITDQPENLAGWLDALPRGIVAHGKWNTSGTYDFNTTRGIFELPFRAERGRSYMVVFSPGYANVITYNVSTGYEVRLTNPTTVDGDAPTPGFDNSTRVLRSFYTNTASAYQTVPSSVTVLRCNINDGIIGSGFGDLNPGVCKLFVTVTGANGTVRYSSNEDIELYVMDVGPDHPNNKRNNYTESAVGGGTAVSKPTTKTYVTTWSTSDCKTYNGNGSASYGQDAMYHGYSSYRGDSSSAFQFNYSSIQNALASNADRTVTIKKCEIYLYANHWWYNSGGTAYLRTYNQTSLPSSRPSAGNLVTSSNWPKPGGRWVNVGKSWGQNFQAGTAKGLLIGNVGSSNLLYYGAFNKSAKIRITYDVTEV